MIQGRRNTKKKGNLCRLKVFDLNNERADVFKGIRIEKLSKDSANDQVRQGQYEYIYFYQMPLC